MKMTWPNRFDLTLLVLAPLGTMINGLVTGVIIFRRQLWTYSNAILATGTSLGVFYNLVVSPMEIAREYHHLKPICSLVTTCVVSVFVALFWLECGIAVERAIFVFKPLHYYLLVTRKRITIFIVAVLLYFTIVTTAVLFFPDPDIATILGPTLQYQYMILYGNTSAEEVAYLKCEGKTWLTRGYVLFMLYANCLPAGLTSVFLFIAILIAARRLARSSPHNDSTGYQQRVSSKNKHTAAVLLACNIIRVLLWIPPLIYTSVRYNLFGERVGFKNWYDLDLYLVLIIFSQLSTIISPLIFAVMQRDFRRSLKTLISCCWKKPQNTVTASDTPLG